MGFCRGAAPEDGAAALSRQPKSGKRVETVVTFLEMTSDPRSHVPPPANVKVSLLRAETPPVHFYRYLYDSVGRALHWLDRKSLPDAALANLIHNEHTDIFVLYVGGVPAGFFEIDHGTAEVELKYFGLIEEFRGRGIGRWLLAEAISACWSHAPQRVKVETCTLDSPAALPLYQRLGFTPYGRKSKMVTIA
jgi:ribosomal protein S18 acetylase RimI-like enzyme